MSLISQCSPGRPILCQRVFRCQCFSPEPCDQYVFPLLFCNFPTLLYSAIQRLFSLVSAVFLFHIQLLFLAKCLLVPLAPFTSFFSASPHPSSPFLCLPHRLRNTLLNRLFSLALSSCNLSHRLSVIQSSSFCDHVGFCSPLPSIARTNNHWPSLSMPSRRASTSLPR